MQPADQVAAFLVGVFGHRTAVDYADIGFGRRGHALEAPFGKLPGERGTLRGVELAAQRMKTARRLSIFTIRFPAGEITKSVRKSNKNRNLRSFIGNYGFFTRYRPLRLSAQRAAACILSGIACGIMGTYVVCRRTVFLAGGITHASFGGLGIAFYLGLNPIAGALVFAVLSALGIEWAGNRGRIREIRPSASSGRSAWRFGVLFMSLRPGYTSGDLAGYLFGSIVTVSGADVAALAVLWRSSSPAPRCGCVR